MIETIEKVLKENGIPSNAYRIYGKAEYYQVDIVAGWSISIDALRQSIFNHADLFIQTDVSCVHTDELGYCMMIEIFW